MDNMRMDLERHYNAMYASSMRQIASVNGSIDTHIDSQDDGRRGITLLLRPSDDVKKRISSFLEAMRLIDPNQYY